MITIEEVSLTSALSKTFKNSDQSASSFMAELKQLTPDDRAWFKKQFEKEGLYKIKE